MLGPEEEEEEEEAGGGSGNPRRNFRRPLVDPGDGTIDPAMASGALFLWFPAPPPINEDDSSLADNDAPSISP